MILITEVAASVWGSATWRATSPTRAPAPPCPSSPWNIPLLHPSVLSPLSCFRGERHGSHHSAQSFLNPVTFLVQGLRQLPFKSCHLLRLDHLPRTPTTVARLMEARKQLLPPSAQRRRGGEDGETTCCSLFCHVQRHPSKRRDGAADRRSRVPTLQAKIYPAAHPGSQSNLKTAFLDFCSSVHTT